MAASLQTLPNPSPCCFSREHIPKLSVNGASDTVTFRTNTLLSPSQPIQAPSSALKNPTGSAPGTVGPFERLAGKVIGASATFSFPHIPPMTNFLLRLLQTVRAGTNKHAAINNVIHTRSACLLVFLVRDGAHFNAHPLWNDCRSAACCQLLPAKGKVVPASLFDVRAERRGSSGRQETARLHAEVIRKYRIQHGTSKMSGSV